jgi:hypothetical protein
VIGGAFIRLFGLGPHHEPRSSSVTASTRAPGHERSAARGRFAGFSLRFEAREAASPIGTFFERFWNIQDTESTEKKSYLFLFSVLSVVN